MVYTVMLLLLGAVLLLLGFVISLLAIPNGNQWQGLLGLLMMSTGWTLLDPDGTYFMIKKWIEKRNTRRQVNPIH